MIIISYWQLKCQITVKIDKLCRYRQKHLSSLTLKKNQKRNLNKQLKAVEVLDIQQQKQQNQLLENQYKEVQQEIQQIKRELNKLSSNTRVSKQRFQHNRVKLILKKKLDHQQQIKTIETLIQEAKQDVQIRIQQSKKKYIPINHKQIPVQFIKLNAKDIARQTYPQVVQQVQKCCASLGQIHCVLQSLSDLQRKHNVKLKLKQLMPYIQKLSFQGKNIQLAKIQFLCSLNQTELFMQNNSRQLKLQCRMKIQNLKNSIITLRSIQSQLNFFDEKQLKYKIIMDKKKQAQTNFYQYYEDWLNFKSRLKGTSKFILINISKLKEKFIQDQNLFKQLDKIVKKSEIFLKNINKTLNKIQSLDKIQKFNIQLLVDFLQF